MTKLLDISKNIATNLSQVIQRQETQANRHQQDCQFNIDDLVLVKMSHFSPDIYAKLPNKKLALKWVGPYKITKQIGKTAYKLELPMLTRFHPVFHANVL